MQVEIDLIDFEDYLATHMPEGFRLGAPDEFGCQLIHRKGWRHLFDGPVGLVRDSTIRFYEQEAIPFFIPYITRYEDYSGNKIVIAFTIYPED